MAETMNVSLPSVLKRYVEQRVAEGGYGNTSEYVRELIRRDQERVAATLEREHESLAVRSLKHLRTLLDEGEQSGPAGEMNPSDWTRLRDEVEAVSAHRASEPR